ncbi:hypothetical protein tb265_16060 [Gemmatimonadetes bacterium T265]|nr:hypothetical protein tb265_16060 [Gemmatimonadetes bacterium T265]
MYGTLQDLLDAAVQLVVLAAVFCASLLLVVGAYAFVNRRRLSDEALVRQRLLGGLAPAVVALPDQIIRGKRSASAVAFFNRLLEGKGPTAALQAQLDRAGSTMTVGTFVLATALGAVVAAFVGTRLVGPAAGAALAAAGALVPLAVLKQRQGKRARQFEAQLPEAVDMLVNAMRGGYSLQAAMRFIGDEMGEPLGPEFMRFYDEQRLGIDVRTALTNMQERNATLDVRMFVIALLIQRESGGNMAEIMTNLAVLMRERAALRGQIDVLTAEPKMSAVVLTLIPIVLFGVLNVVNRDYVAPLYETPTGRLLLAYSVVSLAVGFVVLQRMGKITF